MVSNVFRTSLNVDALDDRKYQAQATWMKKIGAIVYVVGVTAVAGFEALSKRAEFWNAETHVFGRRAKTWFTFL